MQKGKLDFPLIRAILLTNRIPLGILGIFFNPYLETQMSTYSRTELCLLPLAQPIRRKLLFCILFFFSASYLLGQSLEDTGKTLRERAQSLLNEYPDSSLHYIQLACEFYLSQGDTLNYIDCQYDLMDPYSYLGNFDAIDSIIQVNWELAQRHLSPNTPEEAPVFGFSALAIGYVFQWQNKNLGKFIYD